MGLNNATNETLVAPPVSTTAPISTNVPNFRNYPSGAFYIDCNNCGKSILNEHYHCSICDAGDFDLCQGCVDRGVGCDGEEHWLIKRSIRGGTVIPSVTETIAPKKATDKAADTQDMKESVPLNEDEDESVAERTCNSCIRGNLNCARCGYLILTPELELPEREFVTCKDCPDFDLCFLCFSCDEHGHHPGHQFEPVANDTTKITPRIMSLCGSGRGVVHQAICDGCEKASLRYSTKSFALLTNPLQNIAGVRHKCLKCPDWDFCSTCVLSADQIHPGHRFAALYEPISDLGTRAEVHRGIYCDGPLCANRRRKSYIRGDRYKCAVCHDTDFCANCEAVPTHDHNKTHPLIKFKTPVRHVSVTTLGENNNGERMEQMGDHPRARNASTETLPTPLSANAATQVQTVAEVKPVEMLVCDTPKAEDKTKNGTTPSDLQAWFESDSTPDGTKFAPNRLISQSWTLRNPGPHAWPAGCAVYYIGGDDMRNLDANHPSSVSAMMSANRSNVLEEGLEAGKTAVFNVMLRSPSREGSHISYWRVKTPEGVPFGHKLWVDIIVTSTPVELPEQQTAIPPATPAKAAEPEVKDEEIRSQASSTMIFPKLEKESPVSSMHDIASLPVPPVEPTIKTEVDELLEDVESLELEDEETDDGFLTDEEYDILDASDEDFLAEAQKAVQT